MPGVQIDPNDIMIELRQLRKSFGAQQVLRDVTLNIRRGETIVIIGQSGGGKSFPQTYDRALEPDGGEVESMERLISSPTFFDTQRFAKKWGCSFPNGAFLIR